MTEIGPDSLCLASAVVGLFDCPAIEDRRPVWRAWTPDGGVLLFESEREDVARLLVVLLAAQVGSRPVRLEAPDGAEEFYRDGRWHGSAARPGGDSRDREQGPARRHLRIIDANDPDTT